MKATRLRYRALSGGHRPFLIGRASLLALICLVVGFPAAHAKSDLDVAPPLVIQQLSISRERVVFSLAGDLWLVNRTGGVGTQLTRGPEEDSDPAFSPDGSQIAFSPAGSNGADVYRISVHCCV